MSSVNRWATMIFTFENDSLKELLLEITREIEQSKIDESTVLNLHLREQDFDRGFARWAVDIYVNVPAEGDFHAWWKEFVRANNIAGDWWLSEGRSRIWEAWREGQYHQALKSLMSLEPEPFMDGEGTPLG